ncbi:MAG TPA: hypothetical protein VFU31_07345 [Candidatus Binatia bacterium]|nr:hypothetical protein [Candidatus Binatia bacterium]
MMNQLGHLFSSDPLVTQLFFGSPSRGPLAPEKELMLAVLADAVECFCKYSTARDGFRARLFREAEEWIFAEHEELPFSFNNICEALNLNPDYIRHGILEWRVPWQKWGYKARQRDFSLKNVKRIKKLSRGGRLASGRR